MKKIFVFLLFFYISRLYSAYSQTNGFNSVYVDFKKQTKAIYEDFRTKSNIEYSEFVKAYLLFHVP